MKIKITYVGTLQLKQFDASNLTIVLVNNDCNVCTILPSLLVVIPQSYIPYNQTGYRITLLIIVEQMSREANLSYQRN